MGNIKYVIPPGIPSLELLADTADRRVNTVPAGEKWLVIAAASANQTQSSRCAVRISIDGTNYTGWFGDSSVSVGLPYSNTNYGIFPFLIPAGGKIDTRAATFTTADNVIHSLLYYKILEL